MGAPSIGTKVLASEDAIQRENKRRASSLTVVRRATEAEDRQAIEELAAAFSPQGLELALPNTLGWAILRRRQGLLPTEEAR